MFLFVFIANTALNTKKTRENNVCKKSQRQIYRYESSEY